MTFVNIQYTRCIYEVPSNQLFGPHLEFVPLMVQFAPKTTPGQLGCRAGSV